MDIRAEFELAVKSKWSDSYIFNLELGGGYVDEILEAMFWAWQASRQALEGEPFTWVFTDVNGEAKEIAGDPVHRSPQDLRVYTPLYTHPASAGDPGQVERLQARVDELRLLAERLQHCASGFYVDQGDYGHMEAIMQDYHAIMRADSSGGDV